ncbi:MAG: hypothetical protein NTV51_10725 [Verrucomicrobia bacterium]|nr:hypothetical protein [Verrucomicrobiota bacterium]
MRSSFALLTVVVLALFSGCASVPNVDFNRATSPQLKKVAILGITEPAAIEAANLGGTASAFGLIGGLVQGSNNVDRAKKFTAALKEQKFSVSESLLAATEAALKRDGFEVVLAREQKPKLAADGKSDDFSEVRVDADAFMVLWFGVVGYVSEPFSTKVEPWVLVKARLLDSATKKELYFKTFVVGWKMKIENAVFLPADPKSVFKSLDELMAQVAQGGEGLARSCEQIAQRIGEDLKVR